MPASRIDDLGDDFTRHVFREQLVAHMKTMPSPEQTRQQAWAGAQLRPARHASIAYGEPIILAVSG